MDRPVPAAPPVVAVVVAHEPGAWFAEAMVGLASQDYPNLSVLVLASAGAASVAATAAAVLPAAVVRSVDVDEGFSATADAALDLVHGAAFYCFCHDDVALDSSCIRLLVEEAYRSNAGIIGPKLVAWDEPGRLLEVGSAADKGGVAAPYVEPGELDQEQHDAVRDVFAVSSACILVRADLFDVLGGFDPVIAFHGEDLDLCWRAHVAGARVMVNPEARARHRAGGAQRRGDDRRRLVARHRLRTALTCYGPLHRVRVVPQLLVLAVVEALYSLLVGRTRQARDVLGAWPWNVARLGQIRRNRAQLNRVRQVPDNEIRRLQVRGSARMTAFVRGQVGQDADRRRAVAVASRQLVGSLRTTSRQPDLLAGLGLLLVLVVGSRHLLTRGVPAVGELAPFPSAVTMLRDHLAGWHPTGLGTTAPAPTATALLGLAGGALLGAVHLLRTLLVVLPLAVGWLGAHRLARPLVASRARVACALLYALAPVGTNAIAEGRWGGLLLYAAAPWVVGRLARATGLAPFGPRGGDAAPGLPRRSIAAQALVLGLLTAVVMAFVPYAPALVVGVAALLVLGSVVAGGLGSAWRALPVAAGAVAVAVVLNLPWSADLLRPDGAWSALGQVQGTGGGGLRLSDLLRFETGPTGAGLLGWGVLVVAALPLAVANGWRLAWATRAWVLALGAFAVAWANERGWLGVELGGPEPVLAFAAAGLALAGALGLAAFDAELRGARFTWRQVASVAALLVAVVAAAPMLDAAAGGRWGLPRGDTARVLRFLDDDAAGSYRVLWLGQPEVLPVDGWWLRDGLAYGLSTDGMPDVRDRFTGTPSDATAMVPAALNVAGDDRTDRLGRLLAPMGIRYLVVPRADAPSIYHRPVHPAPANLLGMLASQLDLERIDVDRDFVVYRNAAWAPVRSQLGPAGAEASTEGTDAVATVDLTDATPVLGGSRPTEVDGPVEAGRPLYLAAPTSGRWQLDVDGEVVPGRTAFGWANAWDVEAAGEATLQYRTPSSRVALVVVQALLWAAAVQLALRAAASETSGELAPASAGRRRTRRTARPGRISARRRRRVADHEVAPPPEPAVVVGPAVEEPEPHHVDLDELEGPWAGEPWAEEDDREEAASAGDGDGDDDSEAGPSFADAWAATPDEVEGPAWADDPRWAGAPAGVDEEDEADPPTGGTP